LFERRGATAQAAMVPGFSTAHAPEPDPVSEAPTIADDLISQPVVAAPPASASDGIATPVADEMPVPSSENEPTTPIEPTAQEPTEPLAQPVDEPAAADQPAPQSDTFFANGSAGHSPDERSAEDESKHRWFNR
jgi:hypothetical protein